MHRQQELELVGCHSEQTGIHPDSKDPFFIRSSTAYATSSSGTGTPSATDGLSDGPVRNSSANANSLALSNYTGQSGISMFQGLVERARRTLHESADDIGWLQRAPGFPPAIDETEKFTKILEDIRHAIHRLPRLQSRKIPDRSKNISRIYTGGAKKQAVVLEHSKGGIDSATALSLYWPELKDKVTGLAIAQSPSSGTPVASDILREGQLGDYVSLWRIMEILISKVIKGDIQALEDLTYERRKEFLTKHKLPPELPVVSFHTEAEITPTVIASLSHIAYTELGQSGKLSVIMSLAAVMAACTHLLQVRYGEKSDGFVTHCDAKVPGSVVVCPARKLDHAWMVYSTLSDDHPSEADASRVCEALSSRCWWKSPRKRRKRVHNRRRMNNLHHG